MIMTKTSANGAAPFLALLVYAFVIAVAAIGFSIYRDHMPEPAKSADVKFDLPRPVLPTTPAMPNPQPAPLPRPVG
jgi:hypothetical protein